LREDAFERFRAIGFPTTHEEAWRFTNVSSIAQTSFRLGSEDDFSVSQQDLEKYRMVEFACQLVFINGYFAPELSWLAGLPVGLEVSSLAAQIDEDPESIEPHLDRDRSAPLDPFEVLNTAFLQDGAYVHIDRGAVIKDPICLLHVSVSGVPPIMSHPRNLIVAEEGSQAAVIEEYVSLDGGLGFSNAVTELIAGEGRSHLALFGGNAKICSRSMCRRSIFAREEMQTFPPIPSCWEAAWCATMCIRFLAGKGRSA